MNRGASFGAVVLMLSAALVGCGSGGSSSADNGVKDDDGRAPFEVLKAGIMAGNEGDYDGAAKWVVPSGGMVGNNFQLWLKATNDGTVAKIEKIDEKYQGQSVSVGYQLHFHDGSTKNDRASLVKVDGRWKIEWLSTGLNF